MSPSYIVAERARTDIFEIIEYIAADNPGAAERMVMDILSAFDRIATNPGIGHMREDLTRKDVRFWTLRKRYLIVYRQGSPVEFLRVLSGFRDVVAILND